MPILKTHRAIYIHIPKTGGTSLAWSLEPNIKKSRSTLLGKIPFYYKWLYPNHLWWHHLTASEIRKLVGRKTFSEYFKFAFVRNPWDKMSSQYFYWRDSGRLREFSNLSEWILSRAFIEGPLYGEYLGYNQLDYLIDDSGELCVDFVGRFENFDDDFKVLTSKLNINILLQHKNKSSNQDYREHYTEAARRAIEEHFARDIQFFNYKF
jgi:chondroitin 4-sulfotransferase 11